MPIRQLTTPQYCDGITVCIANRDARNDHRAGFELCAASGEVRSD